MTILFGHPTGNPNSFHAALAHFERARLEAICIPWMPSPLTLRALQAVPRVRPLADRLARRHFSPLADAPRVQGRLAEFLRLFRRFIGKGDESLSYEANDWLMRTMTRQCRRPRVTAVHAYEDCSLGQFQEARRIGKACIYDMPIGYYPAWERTQAAMVKTLGDWLPSGGLPSSRYVRPEQKRSEMALADLVLVPSSYVEETVRTLLPTKSVARAAYGVDVEFWQPAPTRKRDGPLRFIYAGQLSLRKGIPLLLKAWRKAALKSAQLDLVGIWQLADGKRRDLPSGVNVFPPCARDALRERYRAADIFVFPSFFEGFGLVLLEAMACGLPAIASEATAGPDVLTPECGRIVPVGDLDRLVEALRWFDAHRERIPAMALAAKERARQNTWEDYRRSVSEAVAPYL